MSTFIRKVMPTCIAILMAFCFVSLIGMEDAHAEAKNAGTITLDFTKGTQRLSGDELEAFNNVMDALYKDKIINYLDIFHDPIYSLDRNTSYEFERHDEEGYSEFRMRNDAAIEGEWSMKKKVDAGSVEEIKNSLIAEGKAYCDDIRVIFPKEFYNVWVEGVKLNSVNAKDVKGDGTVKYDDASKTLTLNGATLELRGVNGSDSDAIHSLGDLTLDLKGTNKIKVGDTNLYTSYIYGVYAKSLTIKGYGSLEVDVTNKDRSIYGLRTFDSDLLIEESTVRINVKNESSSQYVCGLKAASMANIKNGANVSVVSKGTADSTNTVAGLSAYGLTVDESSILESASDKQAISLWSNNDNIDPDTKSRGALVNSYATAEGAAEWNKTDSIITYKYVRMPLEHTAHHWDGKVTKKATPTSTGIMTYTCTACGETKDEVLPRIPKYANTLNVSGKTATVKYKKIKKATQKLAANKVFKFTNAGQGKKSYKLISAKKGSKNFKKYFKINAKTGQVTVKKRLKKGTYKVRATVNAAGDASYNASGWKTVNFKVRVK